MNGFIQDLRFGIRMLAKNPAFTIIAVLTLAVGIGANTAIYSVVDQVILNPFGYRDVDSLVKIWQTQEIPNRGRQRVPASIPNYLDWSEQTTVFEGIGAYRTGGESHILDGGGEPERVSIFVSTANMPIVLGVEPFLGRFFGPENQQPGQEDVIVLNYGLWQRYFGEDTNVLGRTIRLDDRILTVIGVMPKGYWQGSDGWTPLVLAGEAIAETSRARPALSIWARLKPGVTMEQSSTELNTIAARLAAQYPATNADVGAEVWSRADEEREAYGPVIWTLAVAVGLVLLVACANVAHLFLVRATARQKEVAVRRVYGAPRLRLMRQLLTEAVTLSIAGGSLGILIAVWGIHVMAAAGDHQLLPRLDTIEMNGNVLAFAVFLSVATGLFFAIVPAWQSSKVELSETLKDTGTRTTTNTKGRRFRQALLVSEVAFTVVLLVGAGMMIKRVWTLLDAPIGFNPENVLALQLYLDGTQYNEPEKMRAYYLNLLPRLEAIPGVHSATLSAGLPMFGGAGRQWFLLEGQDPESTDLQGQFAAHQAVSPGFFETLRIPVKMGRTFDNNDRDGTGKVLIVSESLVKKYFTEPNPIGRSLFLRSRGPDGEPVLTPHEIVGVVGDIQVTPQEHEEPTDMIYGPYLQNPVMFLSVALRTAGDPESLTAVIRKEVLATGEGQAIYAMRTMEQQLRFTLRQQRFTMWLFAIFAGIALVLATIGTYGIVSYTVAQRTHEFGIRLAMGAEGGDVVRGVVMQGMRLVSLGLVLGGAGAYALVRFLQRSTSSDLGIGGWVFQHFLGISGFDFGSSVLVGALMLLTAAIACYIPARRATRVDPMTALRYE